MWLRVDSSPAVTPGAFSSLQEAVQVARPGDTILLSAGEPHHVSSVVIDKPLCLMGAGAMEDDTLLLCARGAEGALEFHANARVTNLTVRAELGSCLLHKSGRLVVENCALECSEHPLEHLVCPIVSTAPAYGSFRLGPHLSVPGSSLPLPLPLPLPPVTSLSLSASPSAVVTGDKFLVIPSLVSGNMEVRKEHGVSNMELSRQVLEKGENGALKLRKGLPTPLETEASNGESIGGLETRGELSRVGKAKNGVVVVETRIEGGEKAVRTSGGLSLQQVRVMYSRAALFFWFTVAQAQKNPKDSPCLDDDSGPKSITL